MLLIGFPGMNGNGSRVHMINELHEALPDLPQCHL